MPDPVADHGREPVVNPALHEVGNEVSEQGVRGVMRAEEMGEVVHMFSRWFAR
jgi:hypothetical protein